MHSKVQLTDDQFKIDICTTDKKNPQIIFAEIGSYLMPMDEKESYCDDINDIHKECEKYIKSIFKKNDICDENVMFITEIADTRMVKGKKSYLDMQLYMKPLNQYLSLGKKDFKSLADTVNEHCVSNAISFIRESILKRGYTLSKTAR